MILSIDTLKEMLGLPTTADPSIDPVLERSANLAQMMVEAYVQTTLEQDPSAPKTYTRYQVSPSRVVRLSEFPAKLLSAKVDDLELPTDQYTFDQQTGVLQFVGQRYSVGKVEIRYLPGFTPENMPADLIGALSNIALAIYDNGGRIAAASSSGALKSMTMFDAMSMSFETGGATSAASGPEAMVSQWAFVLDKYRPSKYVMGS